MSDKGRRLLGIVYLDSETHSGSFAKNVEAYIFSHLRQFINKYYTPADPNADALEKSCVVRLLPAGSTRPESDMPVAFLAPELRARIWGLHSLAPIKHLQSPESYSATECTGVGIY